MNSGPITPSNPVGPIATAQNAAISAIKKHNMETQFWGYEGGNVIATIAGAGGFSRFAEQVDSVRLNDSLSVVEKFGTLAAQYPDATVTLGLGATVVLAPAIKRIVKDLGPKTENVVDTGVAALGLGILAYALVQDTSWITTSASAFVVGSSFLRQSPNNPFLLKLGGLFLALGGLALAGFGIEGFAEQGIESALGTFINTSTIGTGLYVTGASLLTYEGGIFATGDYIAKQVQAKTEALESHEPAPNDTPQSWSSLLLHPTQGIISKAAATYLDRPIQAFNRHIVKPSIFWVLKQTKNNAPFQTSMWARLPWRAATGIAAALTGTSGGLTFALANLGWAVGDISVGSLDWQDPSANTSSDNDDTGNASDASHESSPAPAK